MHKCRTPHWLAPAPARLQVKNYDMTTTFSRRFKVGWSAAPVRSPHAAKRRRLPARTHMALAACKWGLAAMHLGPSSPQCTQHLRTRLHARARSQPSFKAEDKGCMTHEKALQALANGEAVPYQATMRTVSHEGNRGPRLPPRVTQKHPGGHVRMSRESVPSAPRTASLHGSDSQVHQAAQRVLHCLPLPDLRRCATPPCRLHPQRVGGAVHLVRCAPPSGDA